MKFAKPALATYLGLLGLLSLAATTARADALADIQKSGVLKIAVPQDFAPFGSVNADLQLQGLDIDVAKLIAQKMGVKVQLVPVASANRIAYLQTHKADLVISTLGKNAEREKVIDFSQAYAPYNNSVFGVAAIKVAGPTDLAGKTVGVARGTFQDLQLTDTAPKSATIKRYEDNNAMISAYVSGQVQLVGTGDFVAYALAEKAPDNKPVLKYIINESSCSVGLNKGEPALLAKVNEVITAAKKNGELNGIVQKWLNVPLPQKMATSFQ
nr:transporter substrate-binding domain-containing protein [Herbaspirillum sp. ASV7]